MSDFKVFLEKLGYLHDAVIEALVWNPDARTLEFRFRDIYCNFKGLPEYPGPKSGSVVLQGLGQITVNVDSIDKHLNVHEFQVESKDANMWTASVSFWPSGQLTASFHTALFPRIESR
ncbi:MAG: hypothetical protein ACYC9J_06570 [Sulfuricaulis sp.]